MTERLAILVDGSVANELHSFGVTFQRRSDYRAASLSFEEFIDFGRWLYGYADFRVGLRESQSSRHEIV